MLRDMIAKGSSLARTTHEAMKQSKDKKDLFKNQGTFKDQLKAKIKKRKESNLKKINKVRVKKIKV